MKEYKPGRDHKQGAIFSVILIWIMASFIVYTPIFFFIKYCEIPEDSIGQNLFLIVYFLVCIGIILYINYRIYGTKARIDSKQIIYTNRRSTRVIHYKDIRKLKLNLFGNRSSIKVYTNTQKVRIFLVFKDAYEFVLEMKKGLDASGKSAVYSHKKLFKFIRMMLNEEIMQKWVYKCTLIMVIGLILVFSSLAITTVTDTNIIVALSSCIIVMAGFYIPIFIIQNRYKKETDEESFYFPPRDMEYEKTIMIKGFIIYGIFIAVVIAFNIII